MVGKVPQRQNATVVSLCRVGLSGAWVTPREPSEETPNGLTHQWLSLDCYGHSLPRACWPHRSFVSFFLYVVGYLCC